MAHNTPLRALPLQQRRNVQRSVLTERQLKEHGVPAGLIADRSRNGGPWQQLLPKVYLLHPGPPTNEQRLQAALLYAGHSSSRVPAQRPAMVTGLAALALHRLSSVPPVGELEVIDVLVPHQRRLRDAGQVRILRSQTLPNPDEIMGLACAPIPRALADAAAVLDDIDLVRDLLVEAVRSGRCVPSAVLRELDAAGLLARPRIAEAMDAAVAAGRAVAEDHVYELVRAGRLPDPLWNVSLYRPDGTFLAAVDAYWPDQGVTLEIDVRAPGFGDEDWHEESRRREHLEGLGLCVLYVTPEKLRDAPELQAAVVHTALRISADRPPAALVVALPR
jgi:hypothetical protein